MEKVAAVAAAGSSIFKHTVSVLDFIKTQTDTVVLFYSGGKDSLILIDILFKRGFKINIAFMYLVPEMKHQMKFLKYAEKKYNAKIIQYQHWQMSHYINDNFFRFHDKPVHLLSLKDIVVKAKFDFKCDWCVLGMKQSDSMTRRFTIKPLFLESINLSSHMVYPLSKWKKANCISYLKINKLPSPENYGKISNSSGFDLNKDVMIYLKDNYPDDLEKVFKVFPLAKTLLQ